MPSMIMAGVKNKPVICMTIQVVTRVKTNQVAMAEMEKLSDLLRGVSSNSCAPMRKINIAYPKPASTARAVSFGTSVTKPATHTGVDA